MTVPAISSAAFSSFREEFARAPAIVSDRRCRFPTAGGRGGPCFL